MLIFCAGAAQLSGCYSQPVVSGGVKSAVQQTESTIVPVWGAEGTVVKQCPAGMYGVTIDEPWYGNVLRFVTLGLVGARRIDITCVEPKE